jgi:hypothetical protein
VQPKPEGDPAAGLPNDLARVLRDQSIIVPQDSAVWDLLSKWRNAPSNTMSASVTADDPVETETPVFTEEEVYMIVGHVAESVGVERDVTEETEAAVKAVLSRER